MLREYEKHIADTHVDHKGLAWCGEKIVGFAFTDVDHAALNARNGGRLVPCPDCLRAVLIVFSGT